MNDREWPGDPWIHLAVRACRDALEEIAGKGWGAVRGGEDWQSQSRGQPVWPALVGKVAGWAAGATGGMEPTPG